MRKSAVATAVAFALAGSLVAAPVYAQSSGGGGGSSSSPGGPNQTSPIASGTGRAAVQWATSLTGGTYNFDTNTSPRKKKPDYNCSTLTAAAYRYATGDKVRLRPNSQSQWLDTRRIKLVPLSEAQPGDIFFEKTINNRNNPVGHVGLIVNVNGGDQAIWHACGSSRCKSSGNDGIGYSSLSSVTMWMTVSDPSKRDTAAERKKFLWTSDPAQAYVGRVVA